MDQIIAEIYRAISFERGEMPNFAVLKTYFLPQARFVNGNNGAALSTSLEEFCDSLAHNIEMGLVHSFHEREVKATTLEYGDIALRFSTYESELKGEDKESKGLGINAFQLVRTEEGWRVASLAWNDERPDAPIPAELRP